MITKWAIGFLFFGLGILLCSYGIVEIILILRVLFPTIHRFFISGTIYGDRAKTKAKWITVVLILIVAIVCFVIYSYASQFNQYFFYFGLVFTLILGIPKTKLNHENYAEALRFIDLYQKPNCKEMYKDAVDKDAVACLKPMEREKEKKAKSTSAVLSVLLSLLIALSSFLAYRTWSLQKENARLQNTKLELAVQYRKEWKKYAQDVRNYLDKSDPKKSDGTINFARVEIYAETQDVLK